VSCRLDESRMSGWQALPESNRHPPFWRRPSSPLNEGPDGLPGEIRTHGPQDRGLVLWSAELRRGCWRAVLDSNGRSPASKAGGLVHCPNGARSPPGAGRDGTTRTLPACSQNTHAGLNTTPRFGPGRLFDWRSIFGCEGAPSGGRSAGLRSTCYRKRNRPLGLPRGRCAARESTTTHRLRTASDGRPSWARSCRITVISTGFDASWLVAYQVIGPSVSFCAAHAARVRWPTIRRRVKPFGGGLAQRRRRIPIARSYIAA
jgi:hypothetical protein